MPRVSWGTEEGAGSNAAGFRVPRAVGDGANIHNAEIKQFKLLHRSSTDQVLKLTRENVPSYDLFYSFASSRFLKFSTKLCQFYFNL